MFKDLLSAAKNNFVAHQREEEIRNLDIDPEEYVMLRDDKSQMAIELLNAILEKLKISNWEVDEGTLRIVRISEGPSVRRNWSLAMTSDTRRFHLKVYRDFEGELDEIDLGASRGICAAISFVEKTIQDIAERKLREAEIRRLAALEEERRRKQEKLEKITLTVEQINEKYRSIYAKELSASKLGDEFLKSANEYILHKVSLLPQVQVSLPVGDDALSVKQKFEGGKYKIIDNVPCAWDEENCVVIVSNQFIRNCIEGKNLIFPKCSFVQFESESSRIVSSLIEESSFNQNVREQRSVMVDPRPILSLTEPLDQAERIFMSTAEQDSNMDGNLAKISLLSIYAEVSNFKDLMKTIDHLLDGFSENVNLIVWNSKNSS